jgi:outer membrane protein TolC
MLSVVVIALLLNGCKTPSSGDAPVLTARGATEDQGAPATEGKPPQLAVRSEQSEAFLPPPAASAPTTESPANDPAAKTLTLESAIALTFVSNPDLQSAIAREQIAEAALARARVEFFPTLALNEGYQVSNNLLRRFQFLFLQGSTSAFQTNMIPAVADNFQSELHASWDVYTGGLRQARTRAAAADNDASQFALAAVRERLTYQVAEAYYHLFQAIALCEVRQESVEQAESQLKDVESRIRANTATHADQFKAESYLTEMRAALITANNQVRLSWALLENLVGAHLAGYVLPSTLPPWGGHVALVDRTMALSQKDCKEQTDDEKELAESVASALRERPEVSEGNSQWEAAEHRIRAAKAGRYPTVSTFADYDHYTGTGAMSDTYFIGIAASLYLFDGCRTKMSVRQAKAEVSRILAQNRRRQLDIELEVRRAYLNRKDAREHFNVRSAALREATENLRQTQSRYANQTATLSDVLLARVTLANARVQVIHLQADIAIADAELDRALGRLTRLLHPPATRLEAP